MTAPVVTPKQGAPQGTQKKVSIVPFTRASREKSKQAFAMSTQLVAATGVQTNPIQLPAGGFAKYVDIDFSNVTAANAAAVTFAADGPFNVISFIDLKNSAGDSIIVPFTGYQLMLINKYGALGITPPWGDPRQSRRFSTTAGAVGTGGSFTFIIRVPLEIDPRDAFCAVPNLAANKSYFLQINYDASNNVYGVAPTTPGIITATGVLGYWSQPNGQNSGDVQQQTAPLGNGSVSLWRLDRKTVNAGDVLSQLLNVGNVMRTVIFVLRTAAAGFPRTSADWSALSQVILNDDILHYLPVNFWTDYMSKDYGYTTAGLDVAGSLDTGVFVLSEWNNQHGHVMPDGPRDQFLVTYKTTLLQIRQTSLGGAAASLEIITNEIKPTSPLALYSPNIV